MKPMTRTASVRLLTLVAGATLLAGACSDDKDGASLKDDGAPTTTNRALVSQEEITELKTVSEGKLTACTDTASPPFGFEDAGQIDGIGPELIRGLAGRLARNAEMVPTASEDALPAVESGKCDVTGAVMTEVAKKTHLFSEPYLVVYPSLLVRAADAAKYQDLAALKGRAVGVPGGTTAEAYAKKTGEGVTVKVFGTAGDSDSLFAALEGGQVEAVIHDLPVAAFRASSSGGKTAVTKIFTDAEKKIYALAMPKDRADLKKVVDDGLVQIKSDDTYPTVLRRFLGEFAAQALKDVGGP